MNVVPILESMNVAATLRTIADGIDAGDHPGDSATLILGTEVFHFGHNISDAAAAQAAVWDCQYAIHKLMTAALAAKGE